MEGADQIVEHSGEVRQDETLGAKKKRGRPPKEKDPSETAFDLEKVDGRSKGGRPTGSKTHHDVPSTLFESKTRSSVIFAPQSETPDVPTSTTPSPKPAPSGTSSRPKMYLLEDKLPPNLPTMKLPKNKHVLKRFLEIYKIDVEGVEDTGLKQRVAKEVSVKVAQEVTEIWKLHFGMYVVYGKLTMEQDDVDETAKIVIRQDHVEAKVLKLYQDYRKLEICSQRTDRAKSAQFKAKEEKFKSDVLDATLDLSKRDAQILLRDSPILDWQEDWQHLQNQLKKDQPGSLGCKDTHQQKRDDREATEEEQTQQASTKSQNQINEMFEKTKPDVEQAEVVDEDSSDKDFIVKERKTKKKKVDVMGAVSNTGDRLGLSGRKKAMFAAAVVKAVGVNVEETNISYSTAKTKARKTRFETEAAIKDNFVPPEHANVHWDGKGLKEKAGKKAEYICVYISGADNDQVTKLLGVPKVDSGSGLQQKEVVVDLLNKWDISDQITGMVFDTTASNTGNQTGACKLLEDHMDKALLWIACRHHMYELHIKHVVEAVTGNTKDPGVKLFRRLKAEWNKLEIDYSKLTKFDYKNSKPWLCKQAEEVLAWAEDHRKKGTWPRSDYKELLELVIIWLGGTLAAFKFRFPGADHHARWLSKAIYKLKLALLTGQFPMDQKEEMEVAMVAEFVGLFYAKAFFRCPLPSAAPHDDLKFMSEMVRYRTVQPAVAFQCLQSCYRHLWYLTPSMVVFALCDKDVTSAEKEDMAKLLFITPRMDKTELGKPSFPQIIFGVNGSVPKLSSFVNEKSWLLFDLLGLTGKQDWLQTPQEMWVMFTEYRKLKEYVLNVSVVNDLAERGMHLITEFASKCQNKEEREALLQVVEQHRKQFPDFSKKTLSKV